ncbi:MAG: hypothetical protein KF805_08435 [Phycisphaeraceae bacterium]|nr:hypothetical protein [Phycisphaeraceae bacterium]
MPSGPVFPQDDPGNPAIVVDLQYVGALVAFILDTVVATPKSLKTQYQNTKPLGDADKAGMWAVVSFIPGGAQQVEIAPALVRRTGIAQVTLFGPADVGDKDLLLLARDTERAFLNKKLNRVTFRTPDTTNRGRDGKWWRLDVRCPLYWDEQQGV